MGPRERIATSSSSFTALVDTPLPESPAVEPVGPSLHLGAVGAARSAWLGPAWAALCGLIASAAFSFNAQDLLIAAFALILADWTWPALWTTCVHTDWLAPIAHWSDTAPPTRTIQIPYLRRGTPGDRLLRWMARVASWRRSFFTPLVGASVSSTLVALVISLSLSAAIGWRVLALTLAAIALTGIGALRALRATRPRPNGLGVACCSQERTAVNSDGLRSIVYGTLAWWLGHIAFAPLTAESAGIGVLFGLAYRALMDTTGSDRSPSPAGLIAPQAVAAVALFAGDQPAAALAVVLAIGAQAALRTFLSGHTFARQSQVWLAAAMLICAIAIV